MICEWPATKLCAFGIPHYPLATVTIRVFKGPGAAREEKSLHRLTVEYPMASIQRFAQITQTFDPEATLILAQAFDMACALLGHTPQPTAVREAIAESIIEAAKAGERDPVRLREAGLGALNNSNAA
jgi:hypothetical protein